jgi:hypothetical protein
MVVVREDKAQQNRKTCEGENNAVNIHEIASKLSVLICLKFRHISNAGKRMDDRNLLLRSKNGCYISTI